MGVRWCRPAAMYCMLRFDRHFVKEKGPREAALVRTLKQLVLTLCRWRLAPRLSRRLPPGEPVRVDGSFLIALN